MALNFNETPYYGAWQRGREAEEQNRFGRLNSLNQFAETIDGFGKDIQARRRQAMLDQYMKEKNAREYGTSPLIQAFNKKMGIPSGMSRADYRDSLEFDKLKAEAEKLRRPTPDSSSFQRAEYLDPKGRARIGRWNPAIGAIEESEADKFAPQTARGETAGNLRKEFIDRPEVKDFQLVNTQVKSMDSLLQRASQGDVQSKNFLDQSLISIFNKINDPTSVIRESEYARTPEGLALANRLQGAFEKVYSGGAGLTDGDRRDLVFAAKIIANERGGTYKQTRAGYVNLAQQMTLDPSLITATMPDFSPYQINSPSQPNMNMAPKSGQPEGTTKVIRGATYIKRGGQWFLQ